MRKPLLLVVFTIILSLVLSTVALAHQPNRVVFHGNNQSGSVSFGDHGFAWYHSNPDQNANISISDHWYSYFHNKASKPHKDGKFKHHLKQPWNQKYVRYFYVDDNGVSHYFYLDPDRNYDVVSYKDKNGTTQYYFKATGWK